MKIVHLLFFIILINCGSVKEKPKVVIINSEKVGAMVSFLASDELQGRDTGSEGIAKAAVYIENEFRGSGIQPFFETYRDNFQAKGLDAFNIVGVLEGSDPLLKNEIILIGAHYDHIGEGKELNGDAVANGANDNGAGTTTVINLANYFASKKNNKRTLIFALFSAEEMGLLGSKHLAGKLKAQNMNLYAMVNFEMIGVPMTDKSYQAYITGYDMSNMAEKMNEYSGFELLGLLPKAEEYNLFKRSDNYAFYTEFKVPCQTISTFDFTNYEYYHHVDDEASELDFNHMAGFIKKVIPALEMMANTPTKEISMNEK